MSKSLGNVQLVHDLVTRWPGEALRWALLSAHYRQPLTWTDEVIEQARKALDRLYGALQDADSALAAQSFNPDAYNDQIQALIAPAMDALYDDLNTPRAFSELFALADRLRADLSTAVDRGEGEMIGVGAAALRQAAGLIGFLKADPQAWFQGTDVAFNDRIDALIAQRVAARNAKDWATADRIRAELTDLNIEVMDNPTGATWKLKGAV